MNSFPDLLTCNIAVIGLGYVGLPLAVEFSLVEECFLTKKHCSHSVIGFDINKKRIADLSSNKDFTMEIDEDTLKNSKRLRLTSDSEQLNEADVFIVTVPTPIDSSKRPDLSPLVSASITVGKALKKRASLCSRNKCALIIFESTVYPGATQEVCLPIIERESGLSFNDDFFLGYSPERINPGDTDKKLSNIVKITSGSTPESATWIDQLYLQVIKAGTHLAPSIKVAEAAKVIENTQRDINIALVNELAMIFRLLDIDTNDVLKAASTKWNFLKFKPGLVGGHCIGVDPYYLTYKAEQEGYNPQVVLSGRRINDGISKWIVDQLILALARKKNPIGGIKVLILGLTFKENCPDMRNTKVIDIIKILVLYGISVDVVDPVADSVDAYQQFGLNIHKHIPPSIKYPACICAVAHEEFCSFTPSYIQSFMASDAVLFDLKGIFPRSVGAIRL